MENLIKRTQSFGTENSLYDSEDEYYFECLIVRLHNLGFIDSWTYQPKPFTLADKIVCTYNKTKTFVKKEAEIIQKEKILYHPKKYTADFLIVWNIKAIGFLAGVINKHDLSQPFTAQFKKGKFISVIDIKGGYVEHNMDRELSIISKWVWQRFDIYINIIQCFGVKNKKGFYENNLFDQVFTPKEYLVRPGVRGGLLKVKCKGKTENEFINEYKLWQQNFSTENSETTN